MSQQLIYGVHAVRNLLKINPSSIEKIVCRSHRTQQEAIKSLLAMARQKDINIELVGNKVFEAYPIEDDAVHQDILAVCLEQTKTYAESDLPQLLADIKDKTPLILVLDGVQDPHNLGACIRSADAAGVDMVIFPKDKNAGLSPTVHKVACGAVESVKLVIVTNLVRSIKTLQDQGIWVVGLAGEADDLIYDVKMTEPTAIVMGSEGNGLRHGTRKVCDYLAKIPMCGSVSSLNVSVATGITLYEAVRQRHYSA